MIGHLPTVNAIMNLCSLVFLLLGRFAIAHRNIDLHRRFMLIAFFFSAVFMVSYLIYHYGAEHMTTFSGHGGVRIIYYTILFTHIPAAVIVVPSALVALYFAWQGQIGRHRRVVRWLWPIWVYVSLTGVLIYLMLYHY